MGTHGPITCNMSYHRMLQQSQTWINPNQSPYPSTKNHTPKTNFQFQQKRATHLSWHTLKIAIIYENDINCCCISLPFITKEILVELPRPIYLHYMLLLFSSIYPHGWGFGWVRVKGMCRKHKLKVLRRLDELRLWRHARTISRILVLGHVEPHNLRNMTLLFVCLSIGLVINKVIVVGVVYNTVLDKVLNHLFSFSFGSHIR